MKLNFNVGDNMRKYLIVAIIVVLAILAVLIAVTPDNGKEDTAIRFLTNSTLHDGDTVKLQLTDSQGNGIADEKISISLINDSATENYSVTTDSNGTANFTLKDLNEGSYRINVTYNGSDKYSSSSAMQSLVIGANSSSAQESADYADQDSSGYYSYGEDAGTYGQNYNGYYYGQDTIAYDSENYNNGYSYANG